MLSSRATTSHNPAIHHVCMTHRGGKTSITLYVNRDAYHVQRRSSYPTDTDILGRTDPQDWAAIQEMILSLDTAPKHETTMDSITGYVVFADRTSKSFSFPWRVDRTDFFYKVNCVYKKLEPR